MKKNRDKSRWKDHSCACGISEKEDCYATLLYMKEHAEELGINPNQIMAGGESAGGGLCASLCMMARDKGEVNSTDSLRMLWNITLQRIR